MTETEDSTININILKSKISELIEDNMRLQKQLDAVTGNALTDDIRKLTLQDKLEINMGVWIPKYRIHNKMIKNIYFSLLRAEGNPEFVDLTFDSNRHCTGFYTVDLAKEQQEIKNGETLKVDITKIPDDMIKQQDHYDKEAILDKILDIKHKDAE